MATLEKSSVVSNRSDPLLEPFRLKNLLLRNRVVSTSHEPAYSEEGMPKERYRAYHVEKARGGVALTMIGGSAVVSRDSPAAFGNLHLFRDEVVPWLRELADAVHAEGAAVMCQLTHLGRRTSNYTGDWLPALSASGIRESSHRTIPKVAEAWDLDRVTTDFAAAAQRCAAGGMDGIELEAYGHLIDNFLSPATNRRTDEWGSGLEGRLRFPLQVIRAVRAAVGQDLVVGIRMAVDEDLPGGLDEQTGLVIVRRLLAEGLDFISVIRGHIDTDQGLARVIPSMGTPTAPHLEFAGRVRRETGATVMHAGRISDVATARHAISAGLLDLVGMTRAHLADPHIVRKITTGHEDRIRPCVGASYCLDVIYQGEDAKCIHNPSTGREQVLPHHVRPARLARKAVVIGGGPAGLEAARTLAERGHRVVLFEANDHFGGQLLLASRSIRRRDLIGIVEWRVRECERLGIDLRRNVYAETSHVLAEEPDLVLVATGGVPDVDVLEAGADLVHDTWEVLGGGVRPAGDILIFDDNGGHPGLDAAEYLAERGARVQFVTPERQIGPDVGSTNYPPYLRAFSAGDVWVTLAVRVVAVRREGKRMVATLRHEHSGATEERDVDAVIVEHGTRPNSELYHQLGTGSTNHGEVDYPALLQVQPQTIRRNNEGRYQLFRIGDAVTSRNAAAAILDAYRLCLAC
jgi:N-methyl-L-proline demethylase